MSSFPPELGAKIAKWIAAALGGPKALARNIQRATLSVAHALLTLNWQGFVADIERRKQEVERLSEAEVTREEAEAQKNMAEAAEAVNRANLHKRRDAIARIEQRQRAAEAAKTEAEAEAVRANAEAIRIAAIAEAEARVLEAISKLVQSGGGVFCDPANLQKIIDSGLSADRPKVIELKVQDSISAHEVTELEAQDQPSDVVTPDSPE